VPLDPAQIGELCGALQRDALRPPVGRVVGAGRLAPQQRDGQDRRHPDHGDADRSAQPQAVGERRARLLQQRAADPVGQPTARGDGTAERVRAASAASCGTPAGTAPAT
jgi:hypothetical protein